MTDVEAGPPGASEVDPVAAGMDAVPAAVAADPSPWRRAAQRYRRDPVAMTALGFLLLVALAGLFAPWITNYDPNRQNLLQTFATPSAEHWLGTDDLGRDLFARLVYGARVSMQVSLGVVGLSLLFAIPIGLFSGYVGGRVDNVIMRFVDALLSFPPLILALALAGVLGPGLRNTVIAITAVVIPGFIRLIRGQVLAVRQETFVEASASIGTRVTTIMRARVFPHVISPLTVQVSIVLGATLIAEAALSFLGLGVPPPDPSWGSMLQRAGDFIYTHAWQVFIPGLAIVFTVLAFNTLGDGLRDALFGTLHRRLRLPWRRPADAMPAGVKDRIGITTVVHAPTAPTDAPADGAGPEPALSIRNLAVQFVGEHGSATVVDGVDLDVGRGEIVGLVGESGCGKTMTSLSVLRLIPSPPGRIIDGSIRFEGRELLDLSFKQMRQIRGADIAMVFQDPMASLNPAFTIGDQLAEAVRLHRPVSRAAARERAAELLDRVGIPDARRRLSDYPHAFSGGMRQRAVIAMALACEPRLLIADEPTTALDVTVQAQILDLIRELRDDTGMSVLFVTHDLGVVADLCDRVAVMYAGQIVEESPVHELFSNPRHPYTEGLLSAIPRIDTEADERLRSIAGVVPNAATMPPGCRFAPRCEYATDRCQEPIALRGFAPQRAARCVRLDELELEGTRS